MSNSGWNIHNKDLSISQVEKKAKQEYRRGQWSIPFESSKMPPINSHSHRPGFFHPFLMLTLVFLLYY